MFDAIDVAAGPGGFVAVGYVGVRASPVKAAMWHSSTGRAWKLVSADALSVDSRPEALVGTANGYLLAGVGRHRRCVRARGAGGDRQAHL